MRRLFCDRCGKEIETAYDRIFTGVAASNVYDMCKDCCDAFCRFMGIDTPGGGYEKLDSEVAEE